MKTLKCKPSAQFVYNYTINVSSKCCNIISHRSSVFEGRHNAIDLRRSAHRSSIFESRHIDLRRSTHRSSKIEGGNIAPTTQHHADIPTIRHRILSTTPLHNYLIYLRFCAVYTYCIRRRHTRPFIRYMRKRPQTALVMYYTPIYIAYMR